jgi:hypothetical protein
MAKVNEPLYSILVCICNKIRLILKPEKIKKYGDANKNMTFYVITNLPGGLASQYDAALGYIDRARKKGYVPIVDLCHSNNDCLKDNEILEKNPWEYYFEQPLLSDKKYTIDEVYNSSRVIICNDQLHMVYKRVNKRNIEKRFKLSQSIKLVESQHDFISQMFSDMFKDGLGGVCWGLL